MARKILLADDSVTAQNMGRRILTDAGYEVTTVNNGSAALKKIAEIKPDLIVLDVYMPGYGGLEVCQRLREAQETSRIPVLLTVGKLEPFKADEARRVRADAFIVKPFEASELLTALTKLEDKIVPAPQPQKPSRFARALAAVDGPLGDEKEFGNVETGWKERLKIPPPYPAKAHEVHAVAKDEPGNASLREGPKPVEVGASLEEAVRSRMPDITPEEVAAIQAAAAILGRQAEELGTTFQFGEEVAETPRVPEPSIASATAAPNPAPVEAPVETARAAEPAAAPSENAQPVSETRVAAQGKLAAEEVAAALATLAPAHGNDTGEYELAPVTMAAAPAEVYSGPRWTAESVTMNESESAADLEEEMRKAFSAFAAADAARLGMAALKQEEIVSDQEFIVSDREGSAQAEEGASAAIGLSSDAGVETQELPVVADLVEPTPQSPDFTEAVASPVPDAGEAASEVAAFAAAASAGVVTGGATAPLPQQDAAAESPAPSPVSSGIASQRESELAAAWASWKQVRDSVSSPQFTAQMADAAAAGLKEARQEAKASEFQVEAAASAEDNGAIASIVDSVLAELKPKLMEEIAKKMGKEKK